MCPSASFRTYSLAKDLPQSSQLFTVVCIREVNFKKRSAMVDMSMNSFCVFVLNRKIEFMFELLLNLLVISPKANFVESARILSILTEKAKS